MTENELDGDNIRAYGLSCVIEVTRVIIRVPTTGRRPVSDVGGPITEGMGHKSSKRCVGMPIVT